MKKEEAEVYFTCPCCRSRVKATAKACPHCGSDSKTGWSEGAEFSDLDLPDYDEIVENETGKVKKKNPFAIAIAFIVVAAFAAAMIL